MDRSHLQATLPTLHPRDITGVRVLGVDEVARAKGHDYVTVVYDLDSGTLLWRVCKNSDFRGWHNASLFARKVRRYF